MLAEAAHEPAIQAVEGNKDLSRYVENWGGPHDLGFIAEGDDRMLLGAVWQRLLTGDARGFGYVDDNTPELGIAVCPEHRGNGIGEWLIKAILEENVRRSYPAVSLSVRTDNPAIRLYKRLGFAMVEDSETTNRAGGTSIVMSISLGSAIPERIR